MYPEDAVNAKLQAEKQYQNAGCAAPVRPDCYGEQAATPTRQTTLKDEAEKAASHHSAQANKFAAAHAFLSAHPEFDEFIRLLRNGSLQF
jgi:hypothetical protein